MSKESFISDLTGVKISAMESHPQLKFLGYMMDKPEPVSLR